MTFSKSATDRIVVPGDVLELNEHGNIAWGCRCSAWNVMDAKVCWRCGGRRRPAHIVPTREEFMKLLSVQVPTTYPHSDVFELWLPMNSKLLDLRALNGVPTLLMVAPDTAKKEPSQFTWRYPEDQIEANWWYVGTTMYTERIDEGLGESGPLHLFSSRVFDPLTTRTW